MVGAARTWPKGIGFAAILTLAFPAESRAQEAPAAPSTPEPSPAPPAPSSAPAAPPSPRAAAVDSSGSFVSPTPPVAAPRGPAATNAPLSQELWFEAERRDPATAFGLSFFIGFGAGHFYSRQWLAGFVAALPQVVGTVTFVTGISQSRNHTEEVMVGAATAILVSSRVLDAVWAVESAHVQNRSLLKEIGVAPIVSKSERGLTPAGIAVGGAF